jgi:hypothetical protein
MGPEQRMMYLAWRIAVAEAWAREYWPVILMFGAAAAIGGLALWSVSRPAVPLCRGSAVLTATGSRTILAPGYSSFVPVIVPVYACERKR